MTKLARGRSDRKPFAETLKGIVCSGISPAALAVALAVGMLVGSMPLIWGTSLLCIGAALLLRLNQVVVQAGNFAAWPLQVLLAYPYLHLGKTWFGPAAVSTGATPVSLVKMLVTANGAALGAWVLTAPLLFPLYYMVGRILVTVIGRLRSS